MRASLLASVVSISVALGLSACFPSYLTSRPEAEVFVRDESGAPIEGATVTLGTMKWHGIVGQNTTQSFATNSAGTVRFEDEHTWTTQVALPDGDVRYSWSICISMPGFEATPLIWIDFSKPIKVTMYASAEPSTCDWSEEGTDYAPRVKERNARWIEVNGGEWQTHSGFARMMDESIREAMEESALEQGIKLHSWSQYRFQYQARGDGRRNTRVFVHAICRAPEDVDLTMAFYSEPDDGACFFDTTYVSQSYTDQPTPHFLPIRISGRSGQSAHVEASDHQLSGQRHVLTIDE